MVLRFIKEVSMNYKETATKVLEQVGGSENVVSCGHCATRLRFVLKDDTKANTDEVRKVPGVITTVNKGGQYQVVIGNDVTFVHKEVMELLRDSQVETAKAEDETETEEKKGIVNRALDMIAGSMFPIVTALAGGGMLKALVAVLGATGVLTSGSSTYQMLNLMGDAPFYFLPVILGVSAAKKFKVNEYVAASLGAMLISPTFINMVTAAKETGEAIKFFGISIPNVSYSSSVIPIMLAVWALSFVEPFVTKHCPKQVRMIFVPLIEFLFVGGLTFTLLGPIGNWLGVGLGNIMSFLNNVAPWIVPTLVGGLTPLLVMTGMHYGLIPLGINELAVSGMDTIAGPGMLVSNIAQGGASLAASFKLKNAEKKTLAASVAVEAICGITEPALYGISLPYRKPLYAAMIGGAAGGLFLGIMKVGRFAQVPPSIFALPSYIPEDGSMQVLIYAAIGCAIAFVVSFIAGMLLGVDEERAK